MKLANMLFGFGIVFSLLASDLVVAKDDITTKTLPNGLRIVVLREPRAPIIMQLLAYGVGSMDEVDGKTGLSHVLEHLMFKGTKTAPENTFSLKIYELGGVENAYTSYDYTAYHQLFSRQHLEQMMFYEADRMKNLQLSDNDFNQEIKVVRDERLRAEDDPYDMFYEALQKIAHKDHPYSHPIIGWMPDLQNMTKADAEAWYRKWYSPNHAVLIVAGDVDPEQVFALAKKYYGHYPPDLSSKQVVNQQVVLPTETKFLEFRHPQAELPSTAMAFIVPALHDIDKNSDAYALAILASVLDKDSSSRLEKALVRDSRVARSVWASYYYLRRGPSLFVIGGAPSEGHTLAQVEAALTAETRKIMDHGIDPKELERIKTAIISSQQYQRDSLSSRVNLIARLTMTGLPPDSIDQILDRLQKVTPADVQAVARKYFATPAVIGHLLPKESQDKTDASTGTTVKQ